MARDMRQNEWILRMGKVSESTKHLLCRSITVSTPLDDPDPTMPESGRTRRASTMYTVNPFARRQVILYEIEQ